MLTTIALVALGNALESCLPASWPRPQLDLVGLLFFSFRYRSSDAWGLACGLALVDTLLEPRLLGGLILFYLAVVQLATALSRSDFRDSLLSRTLLLICASAANDFALLGRAVPTAWMLTWLFWFVAERWIRSSAPPSPYRRRWGWS